MSLVLLEFQGGEICQGGETLSRGARLYQEGEILSRGGAAAPSTPPLNEALVVRVLGLKTF